MRNGRLRSLLPVHALAPLAMAVTGLVQIVQALALGHEAVALALGAFVPATFGTTTVAWWLGRRAWGRAFVALLGWFAVHAGLGWLLGGSLSIRNLIAVCALCSSGLTLALASPAFIATAVFARRRDLDAGDGLLVILGLWFAALQSAETIYLEQRASMALPGLALGLVALVVGLVRRLERRRFRRDVTSGRDDRYRTREPRSGEDVSGLPLLLTAREGTLMVVERAEPSASAEGAYRTADLARPVALVRV